MDAYNNQPHKFFTRRVIFNHLEKTAGQSFHALLRDYVGDGAVSPLFSSFYGDAIIKMGGRYPIIFGHLQRLDDELDLTYEHVTLLREPTNRVLSWLNYLLNHIDSHEPYKSLANEAKLYLDSDGDFLGNGLKKTFNLYMQRFVGLHKMNDKSESEKINLATSALDKYQLFGFYEELDEFCYLFEKFLGVKSEVVASPKKINITSYQVRMSDLSSKMRGKLYSDNKDDYLFYKNALGLYETKKYTFMEDRQNIVQKIERKSIFKYKKTDNVVKFESDCVSKVFFGELLRIKIAFEIKHTIEKKAVGISIRNQFGALVYGTNSNLMGLSIASAELIFSFDISLRCHFPCGHYYFGVALVDEKKLGDDHHIYWDDSVFEFEVANINNGMPIFENPVEGSWSFINV